MKKIFNDTNVAFKNQTDASLRHKILFYKSIIKTPNLSSITRTFRHRVFEMFYGGSSINNCLENISKLYQCKIHTVLDYTIYTEDDIKIFDEMVNRILSQIDYASDHKEVPFVVCKPSTLGQRKIFEKVSLDQKLSVAEGDLWNQTIIRFHKLCSYAHEKKVPIFFEAEESWIQQASDSVVYYMMGHYNIEETIIYNTVQLYFKDSFEKLLAREKEAVKCGYKIGLKFVRGAFLDDEKRFALSNQLPISVFKSKREVDQNYNDTLKHFAKSSISSLVIASHNEDSLYIFMQFMEKLGIPKYSSKVWFLQLFGLADNISYNLSLNSYNVAKYMPYGPMKEVAPYMIDRAVENGFIKEQAVREKEIIEFEQGRRKGKII